MKAPAFLLIPALFIVTSCSQPETKTIIKEYFSITVPLYMTESAESSGNAVLHCVSDSSSANKQLYLSVYSVGRDIASNESLLLKDYYRYVAADILGRNLFSGFQDVPKKKKIKGLDALQFETTGRVQSDEKTFDYYHFITAVIEGERHYYEVTVWTLDDLFDEQATIMKAIINSFREELLQENTDQQIV